MRYFLTFFLITSMLNASEDINDSITKCTEIKGDLQRLECFDNIAEKYDLTNPQKLEISTASNWIIDQSVNPLNDERKVTGVLAASSGKSSWGRTIYMIVRCDSKKLEMYIRWDDYLGSSARVTSRIGSMKSETQNWNLSTDSQATFYPGNVSRFLSNIIKNDTLVVQVTPYNENPVTAIFEVNGLKDLVEVFKEDCYVGY